MSLRRSVATLVLPAALAACSPIPKQLQALHDTPGCCKPLAELDYQDAVKGKYVTTEVTETSTVVELGHGRTRVAPYRLPPDTSGMAVRSYLQGYTGRTEFFLCPSVTYLDSAFRVVAEQESSPLSKRQLGLRTAYATTFKVPAEAAFVLVHTAPHVLNTRPASPSTQPGGVVVIGNQPHVMANRVTSGAPCGATGEVEILVR